MEVELSHLRVLDVMLRTGTEHETTTGDDTMASTGADTGTNTTDAPTTGGTGSTGGSAYVFTVTPGSNVPESCLWDPASQSWYVSASRRRPTTGSTRRPG